jgi:hypothetical protein
MAAVLQANYVRAYRNMKFRAELVAVFYDAERPFIPLSMLGFWSRIL